MRGGQRNRLTYKCTETKPRVPSEFTHMGLINIQRCQKKAWSVARNDSQTKYRSIPALLYLVSDIYMYRHVYNKRHTCWNFFGSMLKACTAAIFLSSDHWFHSMHLLPRMNVMLDFICMGPADLPGARRKKQNTKWKNSCSPWDSNPQPWDL